MTRRKAAALLGLTALYFAAGKLGLKLAFLHSSATAVWPASGIALAALLLGGAGLWPAVFLGAFLVNATTAGSWATSAAIAAGNTLEALAACCLTARFAGGAAAFEKPRDILRFTILAVALSPAVAATVGVGSLFLAGYTQGASFARVWLTWWLGDGVGILLATPLIVAWSRDRSAGQVLDNAAEFAALLVLGGAISAAVFGGLIAASSEHLPIGFMCIPVLFWAAYRFGTRETAAVSAALCAAAVWGTLRGYGPFARASANDSLLLLQGFIACIAAPSLAFASACQRTQGELASSVARTRPLFHSNLVGIMEVDLSGRIWDANDALLDMLGHSREDLNAGKLRWDRLTPPEHRDATAAVLRQLEASGSSVPYEEEYIRKDGARLPVIVGGSRIEGTPDRCIAFVLDNTHRKQSELQLQQRAEELARSNAELAQFAFIASHDLEAPLRKVIGFAQALQQRLGPSLDETSKDFMARMVRSAERMDTLIRDLLTLARVTTRARPMELLDLGAIAREVVVDLEAAIQDAGASVKVGGLPSLMGDPTQLRQLLQNLIGNALKFRRPEVPATVRVFGADRGDGFAEIVVEDNGIGFEERFADRIFQPFGRLHGSGQYPGSGIGLAICRRIAMRHGGTIAATSQPGKGARFAVTLPLGTRAPKKDGGREEVRHGG